MAEIITPADEYYNQARLVWNRAINKYPEEIIYCTSIEDVQKAIVYSVKKKLEIRVRGGGHNYQGFSIGNDVAVIDISNLNSIKIDYEKSTFTVQNGIKLGQLYTFLSGIGFPFPGGACPTVCISGLALGGGWGYSSRKYGLTCDSLLELKMVNYEGELITANKCTNSDLFWACKGGGGGNFGVVVAMTFKLPLKVERVTKFEFDISNPSKYTQIEFLDVWQHFITNAVPEINMRGSISNSAANGININCRGLLYGTPGELYRLLEPFSKIKGFKLKYNYVSFLQAVLLLGSVYPQYQYFESYSGFVKQYYDYCTLQNLVELINQPRPRGSEEINLNLYGLGGKVSEVGKFDTAFYYRDSFYILLIETIFKNNCYKEINKDWIEYNIDDIYYITEGSYINFPYYPIKKYMYEYYGENKYRLEEVKHKYDPYNIFNFKQSIK
ncbi:FAD-dependent oxidoreductase [Terrisporobacter mayombei]|uniref:FAD-linked oxidoreductase YvdP n=1 Tax=Terrisporobacter mayombei TaxID=1541 RepID=A0ABY9Q1E2_9FIRM|nr:FAD-binding oxidoreductase [Terrisporobacter mayombei]MCC3866801.1 FAD-binding oxidoreductase [Terrisporobacter mayombei]WMT81041.1 putative FAD-linked oxidoreductase YvdP [Terrisporobacter mayombei]